MRFSYSSHTRTAKRYRGRRRSITKTKVRELQLTTSSSGRKRIGVSIGEIIIRLARVVMAIVEGLLGSGKCLGGFYRSQDWETA